MRNVYLVGFMGAGKSTVGALLAEWLDMSFVDMDAAIEARANSTVAEIFEDAGEAGFRDLETQELRLLSSGSDTLVACGGGVVIRDENRTLLHASGTVVYLRVTAGEALARVRGDGLRPLLAGDAATLAPALLAARESLYENTADITMDTLGRTPEEVATLVLDAIRQGRG